MEDGLVPVESFPKRKADKGLNPCCDGRWSRTTIEEARAKRSKVLILVVMEDGLVPDAQIEDILMGAKS